MSSTNTISKHPCPAILPRNSPCLLGSGPLQHFMPCRLDFLHYILLGIFIHQHELGSYIRNILWGFIPCLFCTWFSVEPHLWASHVAPCLFWDQILPHRPGSLYLYLWALSLTLLCLALWKFPAFLTHLLPPFFMEVWRGCMLLALVPARDWQCSTETALRPHTGHQMLGHASLIALSCILSKYLAKHILRCSSSCPTSFCHTHKNSDT